MGLIYALGAFLSWGLVVPVHFRLLDGVPAWGILAHRILWSSVFVTLLLIGLRAMRRGPVTQAWLDEHLAPLLEEQA